MNPVFNMDAATLSPVALFLQADVVVKIVMGGLLLASIWTWALIIAFWRRLGRIRKGMAGFERDFWKAEDIDAFYKDFEYMALQRHLKILGLFCRLNYRDGKAQYLDDLPTVMEYVRKTAGRYKDLKPLIKLLDLLEDREPQVGYTF